MLLLLLKLEQKEIRNFGPKNCPEEFILTESNLA